MESVMSDKVRINLQVSPELNNILEGIAESSSATKTDVIRQALALVKIAHDAKRNGKHIGLVADSSKLDTEIVGLL
jgi:predicted transcriptional regulator